MNHQLIREFVHVEGEHLRGQLWKERFCKLTVKWAKKIPQTPTIEIITEVAPVIPHIAEAATTWRDWLTDENLIEPFVGNGCFYEGQGAYHQAEPWYKQCLLLTQPKTTHL